MNLKVEVGFKLNKDFEFYDKMLKSNGLKMVFCCITHDLYYTKLKSFDGFSENQIKNSCVRLRNTSQIGDEKREFNFEEEKELINKGYFKVFNTTKRDFHYSNEKMKSCIQLQIIEGIGLVAYYDNPDYYGLSLDEQRRLLIKELNSYGFEFKENELGLDKLRTLYYKKEMFSKNQNA